MLQAKTEEQRDYIRSIIDVYWDDDMTEGVWGYVSFDQMKQIVQYLKFRIRKGYLYKCKKDIYDNSGKVCLFNKDESYLSTEDNMLLSNNGVRMVFQEWHKPQELFEEVDENKKNSV